MGLKNYVLKLHKNGRLLGVQPLLRKILDLPLLIPCLEAGDQSLSEDSQKGSQKNCFIFLLFCGIFLCESNAYNSQACSCWFKFLWPRFSPKHETSITIIMFADGLVINFFDCIILCLEMLGCEELLKSCSSSA